MATAAGRKTIPLSVPHLEGNAWAYVKECLDTGWVSSAGPFVDRFEREFCDATGAAHAVACVNGTAALQVALRIAGVGPGDLVIVPTLTFIATVNAVAYLGADPLFTDSDPYYNLDVAKVLQFLDDHTERRESGTFDRDSGRRIAAVVPVHVFGNAAGLEALLGPCREAGIAVVEDAAESLGTRYTEGALAGRHTGTVGDLGCFSFNGNKIITTGGGGMIVTNDREHARRARYLTTQAKDDEVRYVHGEVGYNHRLTNLQAALGVAQLESLPSFLEAKRRNFAHYRRAVADIHGLEISESPPYARSNHWMVPLRIDAERYGRDRETLMADLHAAGIQTRPIWHLNHLQAPYAHARRHRIERAPIQLSETLNLPCSTNLTPDEIEEVCDRLRHG
jgi:perosamine synthetase